MGFEAIHFEYVYHLLKSVVIGFLIETLLFFPVVQYKRNMPFYFKELDVALVNMVKHIGLIWLCLSVSCMVCDLNSVTDNSSNTYYNRMMGPYWFAYWLMSPFMFLLTQLFWLNWFSNNWLPRLLIAGLLAFSLFAEKIVIFLSSLHRDYLPSSWRYSQDDTMSRFSAGTILFLALWALWYLTGKFVVNLKHNKKAQF